MKLKVLKPFRDKLTGTEYAVGDEMEFEADRAAQILGDRRKLAEKVKAPKAEKPAEEKKPTAERSTTKTTRKKKQ